MVKPIWRKLNLEETREVLSKCPSATCFLDEIFKFKEAQKLTVCCLLWIWWAERNKANAGDKTRNVDEVVSSITMHVMEYCSMEGRNKDSITKANPHWEAPAHNYVKINTDGAFRESSMSGGWGFVVRNDHGEAVAAGYGHLQGIDNAFHVETLALLNAVRITSTMGCSLVLLETDATNLKRAITSDEYDLSPLGVLFREIKALLSVAYDNVKISVCLRSCNTVAHELAARGALLGNGQRDVWVGHLPQFVSDLCAGDLSSISV
jgi:hypothetical protein